MCMMLYLAADAQLPEIRWDKASPALHVTSVVGERGENARRHFSKPFIYYVGSHTGCGCGFSYGQFEVVKADEEAAARSSVEDLARYLEATLRGTSELELYSCWSGDEDQDVAIRCELSLNEIGGASFWFEERQLSIVRANEPHQADDR